VNLGFLMSFTVAIPTFRSLGEICDYLHAQLFWNSIGDGAEFTLKLLGQSLGICIPLRVNIRKAALAPRI
jgi:hypothetical protein